MRRILSYAAAAALLACSGAANAGFVCSGGVAAMVAATSACQVGSTNNDLLNPLQVNVDDMFGYDDWLFAQKDDDVDGVDSTSIDVGLSLLGDTLGGTWSIDDIWSSFSDVMLVFKGGNGFPNTYVAYLLTSGATSGSYISPFTNPNNGNLKNISHVSIYVRGDSGQVSEPGALILFGIGILGIGIARRCRIKS